MDATVKLSSVRESCGDIIGYESSARRSIVGITLGGLEAISRSNSYLCSPLQIVLEKYI